MSQTKTVSPGIELRILDEVRSYDARYILCCGFVLLREQLKTEKGCEKMVELFGTRLLEAIQHFEK